MEAFLKNTISVNKSIFILKGTKVDILCKIDEQNYLVVYNKHSCVINEKDLIIFENTKR